jgi:hypothetical protein
MGVRGPGRSVHDRIIEIEKDLRGLPSDPRKFERRQQPPLNTDDIEEGKLPVNEKSLLP